MHKQTEVHQAHGVPVNRISVMAAFGCTFQGDVAVVDFDGKCGGHGAAWGDLVFRGIEDELTDGRLRRGR